ncbi:serine hydrolase domain-containing protein [Candidatus Methylospira mobilis]|nr:serine hydrolase domain-containing protein [Candidatus Methylospira mobilis]
MNKFIIFFLAASLCAANAMADASAQTGVASASTIPARSDADTQRSTSAGTTFTLPAGWRIDSDGNKMIIEPPEDDMHIALVEVRAKDANSAVAAGWKVYRQEFTRPLYTVTQQTLRDGWDEQYRYDYETSPNEKLGIWAIALRAGSAWTVALIEGSQATIEKRAGPLGLAMVSLRPKGYHRESFAGKTPHNLDGRRVRILKNFVADGMKRLGVPGVGLSLIANGKIVYAGGIGTRELGKPAPVNADTLFMAASNTKALTTLLLGELVDDGKLRWDEPVIEAYPSFKLADEQITSQIQIKHLACACTGLPRQDLEWLFDNGHTDPGAMMKSLSTLRPTSKFGEVFQYSNQLLSAAGYIGASVALPGRELGAAYDEIMQKRVFAPLQMARTTFDFAQATQDNYALPHSFDLNGKAVVAHMAMKVDRTVEPDRPAGGMWTSARDLSRYVMLELDRGKLPNGKQLISEKNLVIRRAPNVTVSEGVTYGMGLMVNSRWGMPVVSHGGSLMGYQSNMIWLPEQGIGAVILTNSDYGSALLDPFMRRLLEVLFDGKPLAEQQLRIAAERLETQVRKARARLVIPPDAAQSNLLATRYHNEALGELTVTRSNNKLVFDVGVWHASIASRKNEDGSISFVMIEPSLPKLEFVADEHNGKRSLTLRDAQHEYVFNAL